MPVVWKSANVPLDSVYGFEAFITKKTDQNFEETPEDSDINVLLTNNSTLNRRKFTFMRSEKIATEDVTKRKKIVNICRKCFTLPGYEQKKIWFERKDDKKQTFCGVTSDLGPEIIMVKDGINIRQA